MIAVAASGCSADEPDRGADDRAPAPDLAASIIQWRTDEGTRAIDAQLTNRGTEAVTVTSVMIDSPAFEPLPPTPKDTEYPPGRTIDLKTEYGAPRCDATGDMSGSVVLTLDDGSTMRLPVSDAGQGWLDRVFDHDCALEYIASVADISLQGDFDEVRLDGERYLSGVLVLERPADSTRDEDALEVVTIAGSTLIGFHPEKADAFPAELRPGVGRLEVPVLLGSARCDGHAFAESKQTYLLNVYVRSDAYPQQRVIVSPAEDVQPRAIHLVESICDVSSMTE